MNNSSGLSFYQPALPEKSDFSVQPLCSVSLWLFFLSKLNHGGSSSVTSWRGAVFHAIVENQEAENLDPVVRAMTRLTADGLNRHEAVHAIASVVAEHIHDLFKTQTDADNSQAIYYAAVERLTAKRWREGS